MIFFNSLVLPSPNLKVGPRQVFLKVKTVCSKKLCTRTISNYSDGFTRGDFSWEVSPFFYWAKTQDRVCLWQVKRPISFSHFIADLCCSLLRYHGTWTRASRIHELFFPGLASWPGLDLSLLLGFTNSGKSGQELSGKPLCLWLDL